MSESGTQSYEPDADITIYSVDHRSEQHAKTVSSDIAGAQPDYVLREALETKTYDEVKDDVHLDGQIATPDRLVSYVSDSIDENMSLDYLQEAERSAPLVDFESGQLQQIRDDISAFDGTEPVVERLDTYIERVESPNNTETYRVNTAVHDLQQAGYDTKIAGMDVHTGASSFNPTMMEKRNRKMADTHEELIESGNTRIVSILGMNHAQDVATLLSMRGYDATVEYPDNTGEKMPTASEYSEWIASEL